MSIGWPSVCLQYIQRSSQADFVIKNASLYTVDEKNPKAEAVAVKDGRIVFVGSNADVAAWIGSATEVVDAQGNFVMPGFIEGHGHIHNLGDFLRDINVMQVKSFDEIVAKVGEAAAKARPGEWIIGRGWHQEKWETKPAEQFLGYPYHDALSKVSPNNPVILTHASGHSVFINAKAMELAGITNASPNPVGGDIVKDASGRLVGVLEETAMGLVRQVLAEYIARQPEQERKDRWFQGIELAEADCVRKGITSFVDAGSSFEQVKLCDGAGAPSPTAGKCFGVSIAQCRQWASYLQCHQSVAGWRTGQLWCMVAGAV